MKIFDKSLKKLGTPNFEKHRARLSELISDGAILAVISKELKISMPTAHHWRKKILIQLGTLTDQIIIEKNKQWFANKEITFNMMQEKAKESINSSDPKIRMMACNVLLGLAKTEADIYSRFNIVNPEKQAITLESNIVKAEDLAQIFEEVKREENENKQKG